MDQKEAQLRKRYTEAVGWWAEGRLLVSVGGAYQEWTGEKPPNWEAFKRYHNTRRFIRREDQPNFPERIIVVLDPSQSWEGVFCTTVNTMRTAGEDIGIWRVEYMRGESVRKWKADAELLDRFLSCGVLALDNDGAEPTTVNTRDQLAEWVRRHGESGARMVKKSATPADSMARKHAAADAPTMPDEVWVDATSCGEVVCWKSKKPGTFRYVRADSIFPWSEIEVRNASCNGPWISQPASEYRFKP